MNTPTQYLQDAAKLCRDNNLIWSADFEVVRHELAWLFTYEAAKETPELLVVEMARKLMNYEMWGEDA